MSTKPKRLNVIVYAGTGATSNCVKHATYTLRRLLGSHYAVITITSDQLLKEPWAPTCALLVFPGGADLGYCRLLNGEGNRRIRQYVQLGGSYLGLCAGGYYGSARCEFEVGKRGMEVVGSRELAFFPGTCRGLAFPGFVYQSEKGARAVRLEVDKTTLVPGAGMLPDTFRSYCNGGGVFVNASELKEQGVEVLATFTDELAVESGRVKAAIVYRRIGEGHVMLTGPHPEFSGFNLDPAEPTGHDDYPALIQALIDDDKPRMSFMKACITKLGLEVSEQDEPVPSLSRLHLSAAHPLRVSELLQAWHESGIVVKGVDGEEYIKGENDTFHMEKPSMWQMGAVAKAVADILPSAIKDALPMTSFTAASQPQIKDIIQPAADISSVNRTPDYDAQVKHVAAHEDSLPESKETPYFNHHAFFANLKQFQSRQRDATQMNFGDTILYGEVVTSTSTLLEKNPSWLAELPIGFTATATTQVAGRGRGTNVWVSPPGSLMFSTVLRHPLSISNTAPVVFVQYIAALAIVAGIQNYDRGYDKLGVRVKWPNDVYALDPRADPSEKVFAKICGILVNSSYAGGDYTLVVGIGMNVNNNAPTVSLSQLARAAGLPAFTLEKLLASILVQFEALYTRFCNTGFDAQFENRYYENWLHTDQIVTLEQENGARARIKGITRDWGLLVAEELAWEDRPTGRRWELQSDSNSFDFLKGLLKRKT